jgi:hypothetical protein
MDCTGDSRVNRYRAAGTCILAGLAKKLMRLGPVILRIFLWFELLATSVSVAAIELPSRAGAVPFEHGRHVVYEKGRCVVCHHTSTGTEVRDACRQCHRPSAPTMPDSRTAFHGSCIGCHEERQRSGQATGPTKRCSGCHTQSNGNRD